MSEHLRSWRLKQLRAREQVNALEAQIKEWMSANQDTYATQFERNLDDPSYWIGTVIEAPEPPPPWGLMLGEAVHNFRSALDHVLWAIAAKHGEPWGKTQFPICTTWEAWTSDSVTKTLEQFVPPDGASVVAILYELQPCNRGSGDNDPLAMLSKLDNDDKHRTVMPIALATGQLHVDFGPGGGPSIEGFPGVEMKVGNVVARIGPTEPTEPYPEYEAAVVPQIALPDGSPMGPAIRAIQMNVSSALYYLEPFAV